MGQVANLREYRDQFRSEDTISYAGVDVHYYTRIPPGAGMLEFLPTWASDEPYWVRVEDFREAARAIRREKYRVRRERKKSVDNAAGLDELGRAIAK